MKDLVTEATLSAVLVTDDGFAPDIDLAPRDITPDADLAGLAPDLADIPAIRIAFASFADGRGFTLARRLRQMGYTGHLRAAGHVLADQYAMARRSGFDTVEITADLAIRQPEDQWRARANWRAHDHRARLMAA
jgi:uncharacterized protein (DUF934 family)